MDSDVDLVFRNAHLESAPDAIDLAIDGGRIVALESAFSGHGSQEVDARGLMASPPFIDAHHHLDCAFLSEPPNRSGTLDEAIRIHAGLKAGRSATEILRNACLALDQALLAGTAWIRCHGDVDAVCGLRLMHPVLEARDRYRGLVDVQFVAFPQLGLARDPRSADILRAAMREGADLVGGMPHGEASHEDAARHIDIAFEIAEEFDADIDMHIDETDDPASRTLELLAEATLREGYQGRVTASHCCALAGYEEAYAHRVIEKVAEAGIHVVTNPMTNLCLQGRRDRPPVRRGITRVKDLLAAGVNVACGLDDVSNMFLPFGRMDMLEVALLTSMTAHLTTPEEIRTVFDMPRCHAARALGLPAYGLEVGAPADLVFLEASDARDAMRRQPPRRYVLRRGRLVAETRLDTRLDLDPASSPRLASRRASPGRGLAQ